MQRFLLGLCLTVSATLITGCGQSSSSREAAGSQPQTVTSGTEAPTDASTQLFQVSYYFAGDEMAPGSCENGTLTVDRQFNYSFKDCRGTKSGQLNDDQAAEFVRAYEIAASTLSSNLVCENIGISADMVLSIQNSAGSAPKVIRSFDNQSDCTRGGESATERLDIFMADLFNALSSSN